MWVAHEEKWSKIRIEGLTEQSCAGHKSWFTFLVFTLRYTKQHHQLNVKLVSALALLKSQMSETWDSLSLSLCWYSPPIFLLFLSKVKQTCHPFSVSSCNGAEVLIPTGCQRGPRTNGTRVNHERNSMYSEDWVFMGADKCKLGSVSTLTEHSASKWSSSTLLKLRCPESRLGYSPVGMMKVSKDKSTIESPNL